MSIYSRDLKKNFAEKTEMLKALKDNKRLIVDSRKATHKDSDWAIFHVKADEATVKALGDQNVEIKLGDEIYPVINTTNWFDSHGDVHIDGIWDVSVKDQAGKLYYIINHELELGKVIAYPEDVEAMVITMTWKQLGKDIEGTTQALVFKVKLTEKGNAEANKAIIGKVALQNSVRMQYVNMELCINEPSEYYKEEYANWMKYYPVIANKEEVIKEGYFWAIREAKIYKEGSAVLFGSNEMTPILTSIDEEKSGPAGKQSTTISGPSADSQKLTKSLILNLMN